MTSIEVSVLIAQLPVPPMCSALQLPICTTLYHIVPWLCCPACVQDEDADEAQSYDPFQFMLQFMLQPLLVASGSTPAGATIPAIVKMCQFLKKTADISVSMQCRPSSDVRRPSSVRLC